MRSAALGVVAALWLASPPAAVAEHLEAKMYVISDWDSECPASDRGLWDDMVDNWYDEITDHGWYHRAGRLHNGNVDRDPFCDPDTGLANCDDGSRLDAADAAMIGLHGADSGNHWVGSLRRNGGAGVNDCSIDGAQAAVPAGELHAGDVDLEFLHLSSCFSMDDDNLPFTYFNFEDAFDSPGNGRRLHQLDGFHGIMYIGGCCDDQYEDFADDAFDVSIKEAWLDNMYVTGINGSSTQCPVAYAVGSNRSDCFNRIDHEQYDNVMSDPGSIGYYCYYYYDGCDPDGEGPFTDPN